MTESILAKAPTGEIIKTGISERRYIFFFGWRTRLYLEEIYGSGLASIDTEADTAALIANLLLCGLKSRSANNLPDTFSRVQMYELLDDLSESDIKEVYEVALHSLGFISRILGIDADLVQKAVEKNSPTDWEGLLAFALGEMGMTPDEFWDMTPYLFEIKQKGYLRRENRHGYYFREMFALVYNVNRSEKSSAIEGKDVLTLPGEELPKVKKRTLKRSDIERIQALYNKQENHTD